MLVEKGAGQGEAGGSTEPQKNKDPTGFVMNSHPFISPKKNKVEKYTAYIYIYSYMHTYHF